MNIVTSIFDATFDFLFELLLDIWFQSTRP